MSDNKDLTPEEIGAILDSYPEPEGGESSAEEVEDPIIPPFGTPDLRMCKKCGAKAYLRKGGCTNRGCDSGLQGFQGFFKKYFQVYCSEVLSLHVFGQLRSSTMPSKTSGSTGPSAWSGDDESREEYERRSSPRRPRRAPRRKGPRV